MEKCGNCERTIGNMEPAHVYNGAVVCDACNVRLLGAAAGAGAQPAARPAARAAAIGYASPQKPDAISTLIPYRNAQALTSYYLGIFSLLPGVGAFMGIAAVILGIRGLIAAKRNPAARGAVHAWVGIICGGIFGLAWLLVDALAVVSLIAAAAAPHPYR